MKPTLVIGASLKKERYSNKAIRLLRKHNHPVFALGLKKGNVKDVSITDKKENFGNINTVTIYLNQKKQAEYYQYIISLNPERIIFNPGTENKEFKELAKKNNIKVIENCTLVMLGTGLF